MCEGCEKDAYLIQPQRATPFYIKPPSLSPVLSAAAGYIYPKSPFEVGFIAGRAGAASLVQRKPSLAPTQKDTQASNFEEFACGMRKNEPISVRWLFFVISDLIKQADEISHKK